MKAILIVALVMGLLSASNAPSATIYIWTDAAGIQRFSNDPPPKGVENYKQIESRTVRPDSAEASNQRRPSYDRMVQQAIRESQQLKQERKAKEAARAAQEKRLSEERRQAKIEAERRRLQEQIKAIKNRAVSPTYPLGMKQAQIDKIREQIDALEKKTDADASQKHEKAAESKSGD